MKMNLARNITNVLLCLFILLSGILANYSWRVTRQFKAYRESNPIGQINVLSKDYTVYNNGKPTFVLPKGTVLQDVTPPNNGDTMVFSLRTKSEMPKHGPLIPSVTGWHEQYLDTNVLIKVPSI